MGCDVEAVDAPGTLYKGRSYARRRYGGRGYPGDAI